MTPNRVAVVLLAFLPLGCSLLAGPESPFSTRPDSLRSAGGADAQEESYRADVRDYTYAYVDADGEDADFEGGLGRIAERHGVADWDAADSTYVAIGAGLAQAQVSATTFATYQRTLGRADPLRMSDIQRGFDRGR